MSWRLTGEAGGRRRRSVAAIAVAAGLLVSACSATGTTSWHLASGTVPTVDDSPVPADSPTPSRTASPSPTAAPHRSTRPSGSPRPTRTLDARTSALVARTPRFGPGPQPIRVTLPPAGPGMVPWIHTVPTTQRVVFITVDDGYVKDPAAIAVIKAANIRLTAFLTVYAVNDQIPYYRGLQHLGSRIESHAITHKQLKDQPPEFQREQICGSADWLALTFGQRPGLLRPPYGLQDDNTLTIAHDCGYRAAVHWSIAADHAFGGGAGDPKLSPGDILLLHWSSELAEALVQVLLAIKKAGLTPALLEDYI